jgi:hypothetical protein
VRASLLQLDDDELGDIVLDAPYAGLARTVFGDTAAYGKPHWRGDLARFEAAYFPPRASGDGFGFVQGDAAREADGAFTFHGRRDEVINVMGVRLGLEELEKVAWSASDGILHDLAIVGAPDSLKGQVQSGGKPSLISSVPMQNRARLLLLLLFRRQSQARPNEGCFKQHYAVTKLCHQQRQLALCVTSMRTKIATQQPNAGAPIKQHQLLCLLRESRTIGHVCASTATMLVDLLCFQRPVGSASFPMLARARPSGFTRYSFYVVCVMRINLCYCATG